MAEGVTIRADQIEGLPELIREQLKAIRQEDTRSDLQDVEEVRRSPAGTLIRLEEQIKALGTKMDQRFEVVDQRLKALEDKMDQRFMALKLEMDQRFGALDSKVDQRFNDMERRFSLFQWVVILNFSLLIAVAGKLFLMK